MALGGSSKDDSLEATPLVEDGFMYVVDSSGIVSKIDVRSGMSGPIMWQMNPKQEKPDRNRGVALWNNLVIEPFRTHRQSLYVLSKNCQRGVQID